MVSFHSCVCVCFCEPVLPLFDVTPRLPALSFGEKCWECERLCVSKICQNKCHTILDYKRMWNWCIPSHFGATRFCFQALCLWYEVIFLSKYIWKRPKKKKKKPTRYCKTAKNSWSRQVPWLSNCLTLWFLKVYNAALVQLIQKLIC